MSRKLSGGTLIGDTNRACQTSPLMLASASFICIWYVSSATLISAFAAGHATGEHIRILQDPVKPLPGSAGSE